MALNTRTNVTIRQAIIDDVHRREATLRILYRLSSSESTGAECSDDDIIEIGRLSEGICRNVALEHRHRDRLRIIDSDMLLAIIDVDNEYRDKKSIIDGSRGAEDVWNSVWSKYHQSRFRRLIRRLQDYFWCVHVRSTF